MFKTGVNKTPETLTAVGGGGVTPQFYGGF